MFKNKTILITGGTGSFGAACAKYLYKNHKPKKIIIFSRDELKQFEMQNTFIRDGYNIKKFRFFSIIPNCYYFDKRIFLKELNSINTRMPGLSWFPTVKNNIFVLSVYKSLYKTSIS